jgi:hypothetical protein
VQVALDKIGDQIDYIGNWWVDGNPYKAIHLVVITGNAKFELQLHTAESMAAVEETHAFYQVYRDSHRPLGERVAALERSVAVFDRVPTPAGVAEIGERVVGRRPGEKVVEPDTGAEARREMERLVATLAGKAGVEVSIEPVTLPADLREAFDRGNEAYARGDLRAAFEAFREAENRYLEDLGNQSVLVRRAVAEAMLCQGVILFEGNQPDEALTTFTHAGQLAEIAHDAKRAARAREYRRRVLLYMDMSATDQDSSPGDAISSQ